MWTMWDAPSDRDYYGEGEFIGEEPDEENECEPEMENSNDESNSAI